MRRQRMLLAVLALAAGCSASAPVALKGTPTPIGTTAQASVTSVAPRAAAVVTRPAARPTSRTPRAFATTRSPVPRATSAAVRASAPAVRRTAVCPGLSGVTGTQVLLVVGSGSTATARMCEKRSGQWTAGRSMRGHVGRNGVAPAGAKREGDGRTPSGTYVMGRGFGQSGNPGVRFRWTVVDSRDVWVDDVHSSLYNSWQREPASGRWASAERLQQHYYALAQVVDYNTARVPGKGSGIFLHLDHASGTAGCITLQKSDLLAVLRWERPGAHIVIR